MIKKYGVIDLENGETTIIDTREEAIKLFVKRMINFSLPYFHNTPFVSIEFNDDGTETWYNESEQEIDKILNYEEHRILYATEMPEIMHSIPVAVL